VILFDEYDGEFGNAVVVATAAVMVVGGKVSSVL
jgi:hypothetical protein